MPRINGWRVAMVLAVALGVVVAIGAGWLGRMGGAGTPDGNREVAWLHAGEPAAEPVLSPSQRASLWLTAWKQGDWDAMAEQFAPAHRATRLKAERALLRLTQIERFTVGAESIDGDYASVAIEWVARVDVRALAAEMATGVEASYEAVSRQFPDAIEPRTPNERKTTRTVALAEAAVAASAVARTAQRVRLHRVEGVWFVFEPIDRRLGQADMLKPEMIPDTETPRSTAERFLQAWQARDVGVVTLLCREAVIDFVDLLDFSITAVTVESDGQRAFANFRAVFRVDEEALFQLVLLRIGGQRATDEMSRLRAAVRAKMSVEYERLNHGPFALEMRRTEGGGWGVTRSLIESLPGGAETSDELVAGVETAMRSESGDADALGPWLIPSGVHSIDATAGVRLSRWEVVSRTASGDDGQSVVVSIEGRVDEAALEAAIRQRVLADAAARRTEFLGDEVDESVRMAARRVTECVRQGGRLRLMLDRDGAARRWYVVGLTFEAK